MTGPWETEIARDRSRAEKLRIPRWEPPEASWAVARRSRSRARKAQPHLRQSRSLRTREGARGLDRALRNAGLHCHRALPTPSTRTDTRPGTAAEHRLEKHARRR